jgi:type IV secretory pathway VirB9-like protein
MTRFILPGVLTGVLFCSIAASAQPTREVTYSPREIIRVNAHLRMTTLLILPENEDILDYVCGDKDFWVISGAQNLAYVKPAKAGATTNLNLVTAAGRVYSFLLVEGEKDPDLKLFVLPDPKQPFPARPSVRMTTSQELEEANRQLAIARDDAQAARREAAETRRTAERNTQDTIEKFRSGYPFQMHFPYAFDARTKPFDVTAIFHDGRFTYIRANGRELPSVYEVIDHVPNLVGYQVEQGVIVVSKVIDHGYLAIGKRRLSFDTVER